MKPIISLLLFGTILGVFFLSPLFAGTIQYTYDDTGRLTGVDYGNGATITYTYDSNGNLLERKSDEGGNYALDVAISPTGIGAVAGIGIYCPGDCTGGFDEYTQAQLTATPEAGNLFLGWGGDLTGTANPGTVTMDDDKTVTAYFGDLSGSTDTDGVSDTGESGPDGDLSGYDGDGNNTADYQEAAAASLASSAGGAYVTIALSNIVANEGLSSVAAQQNPSSQDGPAGIQFKYDFFNFVIEDLDQDGDDATATLYLPKNESINTFYIYGPLAENQTDHWYEFLYDDDLGAQIIHDADQTRIVLHLRDGDKGDADLTANGRILILGAPGKPGGSLFHILLLL